MIKIPSSRTQIIISIFNYWSFTRMGPCFIFIEYFYWNNYTYNIFITCFKVQNPEKSKILFWGFIFLISFQGATIYKNTYMWKDAKNLNYFVFFSEIVWTTTFHEVSSLFSLNWFDLSLVLSVRLRFVDFLFKYSRILNLHTFWESLEIPYKIHPFSALNLSFIWNQNQNFKFR